ncbi:MAG: viologen exporter family transport system permease protein [Actinomycetota bacterium]|jgi:ABC-2 type transport system permease protein
MTTRRAVRLTMGNAFREAAANRAGFWTQVVTMIVNNAVWVLFWGLFFHRVGRLRGWDAHSVYLLLAALCTSAGIVLGFLANSRAIGRMVADGELDAALALPTRPLVYLLVRRVNPINMGDILFGVVLFFVAGDPTPTRTLTFVIVIVVAAVVLAGFLVAAGSLAFFAGRDDAGELGFHTMLLFGAYPVDIFGSSARLVLHTIVPAAFVAAVPARLVQHFDFGVAAGFVTAAVVFGTLAIVLFEAGLRRYTSGAVWTRA